MRRFEKNMKKLGQFILSDKIIEKMRDKIKRNERVKKELGFSLFQKNNILIDRWHCTGNKGSIFPSNKCINGEELVGGFHTHPHKNSEPSIGDMQNAYREGFECIGGFLDQKIVCYIRKTKFDKAHLDDITLTKEKVVGLFMLVKAAKKDKSKYLTESRRYKINNEYNETLRKEKTRILENYFEVVEL